MKILLLFFLCLPTVLFAQVEIGAGIGIHYNEKVSAVIKDYSNNSDDHSSVASNPSFAYNIFIDYAILKNIQIGINLQSVQIRHQINGIHYSGQSFDLVRYFGSPAINIDAKVDYIFIKNSFNISAGIIGGYTAITSTKYRTTDHKGDNFVNTFYSTKPQPNHGLNYGINMEAYYMLNSKLSIGLTGIFLHYNLCSQNNDRWRTNAISIFAAIKYMF